METFLTSLAAHPNLTPGAVRAAQALKDNAAQKKVCLFFDAFRRSVVDNLQSGPFLTSSSTQPPCQYIMIVCLKEWKKVPEASGDHGGRFFSVSGDAKFSNQY